YRLETVSESRLSEWVFEPFTKAVSSLPPQQTFPAKCHVCSTRLESGDGHLRAEELFSDLLRGSLEQLDPPATPPPDPWDVEVRAPCFFQGRTRRCQVPHSVLVRDCHRCRGHGRSKCGVCHGAGRICSVLYLGFGKGRGGLTQGYECRCKAGLLSLFVLLRRYSQPASRDEVCNVRGLRRRLKHQKRCQRCSGTGRQRCHTCSGRGSKTCATCQGEKKLQHFRQLVISWKNKVFEFVSEHHLNFPGELLSKVSGENIFKGENVVVYPIIDFPDPEISLASQRAIAEHSTAFATSSRILRQ
ncbi:PREDICTED: protein SSUH2 homolog, partial [Cariama cristata]|uniref:protein SSUH2 homolog n=1 Tax=Cariama cristata TaxID=54380 RepID=UPI0005200B1D